jgi:hypothetical protein
LLRTPITLSSVWPILMRGIGLLAMGPDGHTSSINCIVDPAKFLDGFLNELLDLLCAGDICLDDQHFGLAFADCFSNLLLRLLESGGVAVRQYDFGAAFAGERDGCCLADAWYARDRLVLFYRRRIPSLTGSSACDKGDTRVEGHCAGVSGVWWWF